VFRSALEDIYYFIFISWIYFVQDFVCMSQEWAKKESELISQDMLVTINGYKPALKESVHYSRK
jgi:hypothetical protein